MHELGLAQSILDIVNEAISDSEASSVQSIHLRVGRLAGVDIESLTFCFEAIVTGTPLAEAKLVIQALPLVAECAGCGRHSPVEALTFTCPACGGGPLHFPHGDELAVTSVELKDNLQEAR